LNWGEPGTRGGFLCRLGTGMAVLLCLAVAALYVVAGRLNADEGWYLYASRLVYEGNVPYRDFAYTQTPLLPYVYGLPQVLLGPSTYLGRVTSALLLALNLLLGVHVARRTGGQAAGCITAWLTATFTYGIYLSSIVKTYSLLSLLFTSVLVVLTSKVRAEARYPAAALLAVAAAMLRLTAAAFALVVAVYCVARSRRAARWLTVAVLAVVSTGLLLFACCNGPAVEWNLVTFHVDQRGGPSGPAAAIETAVGCLLVLPWFYLSYFLLVVSLAAAMLLDRRLRAELARAARRSGAVVTVGLGLTLYVAVHVFVAGCLPEYLVPAILSSFPLLAVSFAWALGRAGGSAAGPTRFGPGPAVCWIGLAAAVVLHPLRYTAAQVDLSGGELPVEEVRELAGLIAAESGEADQVLALEALSAVAESGRAVLPGLTMAQFSLQDVTTDEAERLGIVNPEMVLSYLREGAARIVVLTDYDWQVLERTGCREQVQEALVSGYLLVHEREEFGQRESGVQLYVRSSSQ
jgi:hypothetical protein